MELSTTVTSKGQVTILKQVREALGIINSGSTAAGPPRSEVRVEVARPA